MEELQEHTKDYVVCLTPDDWERKGQELVAAERERLRKGVELIVPVGVEPEDWMISRQAVLDLLSEPTNSKKE